MSAHKHFPFKWRGRSGFTLVELIVVIGLMAFLATVSASGYFAVTRGMASRGAIQDTASIIRFAMQTCLIDQVPTAVLFMNYRSDSVKKGGDAYGRAIVIRMSGRISYVAGGGTMGGSSGGGGSVGKMLVDEFADWQQSFAQEGENNAESLSIRLYRMQEEGKLKSGIYSCSSLMCNWVAIADSSIYETEYLIGMGQNAGSWCDSHNKRSNFYRWGLPFHQKNDGISPSEWRNGDAYGMSIAEFTLPKNYIFGKSVPSDTKMKAAEPGALVFFPDDVQGSGYQFGGVQTVSIFQLNDIEGKDVIAVGKIDSQMLKDQD